MRLTLAMGEQTTVVKQQGQEVLQAALALPSGVQCEQQVDAKACSVNSSWECATAVALWARPFSGCRLEATWPVPRLHVGAQSSSTAHTCLSGQSGTPAPLGARRLPLPAHRVIAAPPATPSADPRERAGLYWGYTTRIAPSLAALTDPAHCPFEGGYDLTVGTSGGACCWAFNDCCWAVSYRLPHCWLCAVHSMLLGRGQAVHVEPRFNCAVTLPTSPHHRAWRADAAM